MWHNRELVHGTLMYDVDIETLTAALNVEGSSKLNLKGVGSVRSRVTNVRDYLPQFSSLDELQAALQQYLVSVSLSAPDAGSNPSKAAGREYLLSPSDLAAIDSLCAEKFSIDGWILR